MFDKRTTCKPEEHQMKMNIELVRLTSEYKEIQWSVVYKLTDGTGSYGDMVNE